MNKKGLLPCSIVILTFYLSFLSCKKELQIQVPTLTTTSVTDTTLTTAVSGGIITSDGGSDITARGVCWSTEKNPSIIDSKTVDGTGVGSFISNLSGLKPWTDYYVRSYATNSAGTGYGDSIWFVTLPGVIDVDGNVYSVIKIGTQVWMAENLKVTHYRNGDPIPNITDSLQWKFLLSGAYCDYDNNPDYSTTYGKLYNSYAAEDNRGLAPLGWHVPNRDEWVALIDFVGGSDEAGGKLKETGLLHWKSPNYEATNEYHFNALPVGARSILGIFDSEKDIHCYWWGIATNHKLSSHAFELKYNSSHIIENFPYKKKGISVRCIKD